MPFGTWEGSGHTYMLPCPCGSLRFMENCSRRRKRLWLLNFFDENCSFHVRLMQLRWLKYRKKIISNSLLNLLVILSHLLSVYLRAHIRLVITRPRLSKLIPARSRRIPRSLPTRRDGGRLRRSPSARCGHYVGTGARR